MRIVAALGGNALLERGEPPESAIQEAHIIRAVQALAPLAADHDLVLTHGNGPQVGMLALESAHDPAISRPYPFDVLGAQTQGMIGYWLVQALQNALPGRQVACLISRTLVKADDPAFAHPAKFVGPVYDEQQARALAASQHWEIRQDGSRWRRVVPSSQSEHQAVPPGRRRCRHGASRAEVRGSEGQRADSGGGDDGDRTVGVVQDGVPDRVGAWQPGVLGVPADDHQVGAGGQADQGPARMTVHDIGADRYVRVLLPPVGQQSLELPGRFRFESVRVGSAEHISRPGDVALRRVPGVDRQQAGLARARFLEREGERVGAVVQVADADYHLPVGGRGLVADDHDRAGRVAGRVPADRAEHHRREGAAAAGADDQHQRACPGLGDGLGGLPAQLVGVYQQAGGRLGGPFRRRGQGPVTLFEEDVGHGVVFGFGRASARDHPGQ